MELNCCSCKKKTSLDKKLLLIRQSLQWLCMRNRTLGGGRGPEKKLGKLFSLSPWLPIPRDLKQIPVLLVKAC